MKLLLLFSSFVLAHSSVAANRPNVLFIAFDDMRPQLGCFGDPTVKSPNLDALAQRGMVFKRSYVQQALCSRSRISMLSGRYPATTGIFEIGWSLRTTMPDIATAAFQKQRLPHAQPRENLPHRHRRRRLLDHSRMAQQETALRSDRPGGRREKQEGQRGQGFYVGPAFEMVDGADDDLLDGDCAANAIAQLREHAASPGRPFFLAVGFANPHVPWVAPTSGMRYAPEMRLNDEQHAHLGDLRWITSFTCKTWERYGIHALEAVEPLLGTGFVTVQAHSDAGGDIMHVTHRSGVRLTIGALHDAYGSFGAVHASR